MFGYIICNKQGLSEEELKRYRQMYCGVCRSLRNRYGQLSRFSLNFDMTFLALFLTALYEPEEEGGLYRCPLHPLKKQEFLHNVYIDYAADMTVALAYFKCLDDWEDERKGSRRLYAGLLKDPYREVSQRYPRQCENISRSLEELHAVEKSHPENADLAVNLSGQMLSEVFVCQEDFWSGTLRQFGFALGRFIYLMDASMDYAGDMRKKNYNPLFYMGKKPEEMEEILTGCISPAAAAFEQLPIVEDEHLIRNVLYGGVWQKYYAKFRGKETRHGGGSL